MYDLAHRQRRGGMEMQRNSFTLVRKPQQIRQSHVVKWLHSQTTHVPQSIETREDKIGDRSSLVPRADPICYVEPLLRLKETIVTK